MGDEKISGKSPQSALLFPDEARHLDSLNHILEEALAAADMDVDRRDREYREQKRYMAEYRGEIDPHEMFQNELALGDLDHTGAHSVVVRNQIAKLRESPYFARIDFQAGEKQAALPYYIGRFSFAHENRLLVFDWRAPVSGMFYDCEVGPAGYDAPTGRVEGALTRKRQFKIRGGSLEYVLETSANIQDDVLQRELSQTSDEKMKSIIATIQKEQNQIIRNEKAGTMLIQGVAGSGKTSIALHRIAFLLYRFKSILSAKQVAILSPNKVFGDYIGNVLPELGEEPIREISFEDIAKLQLEGIIGFEQDRDPLEPQENAWTERTRFKSTLDFVDRLERFIEKLPQTAFHPEDCTFGGLTAKADVIQNRFAAYSKYPVKARLQLVAEDLHSRFETALFLEEDIPKTGAILKRLRAMLRVKSTLALYRLFYQEADRSSMLSMPARNTLEWADVAPFLCMHAAFEGLRENGVIRHLVVDEMQDYTPAQYALLNRLFPCQKTILGDFGQRVNPNHLHTLGDLERLYGDAQLVELRKSYRSTYEIINFAKRIQDMTEIEPMKRHGEEPAIKQCGSQPEEIAAIGAAIEAFEKSGRASLGILAKTNREAQALYESLVKEHRVRLLSPTWGRFENGVSVTSIQMSKGLEFDEVLVADADRAAYATDYDRSLLYVACTRAMHRLSLFCVGEVTPLIGGKSCD